MSDNNDIHPTSNIYDCSLGNEIRIFKNTNLKKSLFGSNLRVGDETIIYDSTIENNVEINRRNLILNTNLGQYSYTGVNTIIRSATIGSFCSISWNVSIGGADHSPSNVSSLRESKFNFLDQSISDNSYEDYGLPCIIGSDVLISTNAIILRNVEVGDGAIIGAGAVVTRDVEPYSIVAGVPAKKIKMRFDQDTIAALLEIKWWNWPIEIIRKHQTLLFSTRIDKLTIEKMRRISSTIQQNGE